jgi:hypothetical protein
VPFRRKPEEKAARREAKLRRKAETRERLRAPVDARRREEEDQRKAVLTAMLDEDEEVDAFLQTAELVMRKFLTSKRLIIASAQDTRRAESILYRAINGFSTSDFITKDIRARDRGATRQARAPVQDCGRPEPSPSRAAGAHELRSAAEPTPDERPDFPRVLVCAECGARSPPDAQGWRAYLDVDGETVTFCPACSAREFGAGHRQDRRLDVVAKALTRRPEPLYAPLRAGLLRGPAGVSVAANGAEAQRGGGRRR